jgi:hypothetical protein
MASGGQHFMINNLVVTTPDEEVWSPILIGDALSGTQRRSPYQILEWRKQVADRCRLDWFDFDNTVLAALVCTPPGETDQHERYTDAICQSVGMRKRHSVANEVVARFMVNTG